MKKITTFAVIPLLALFLVLWSGTSNGQTSISLGSDQTSLVAGEIVLVPIIVTSTFESADIYITYDKDVLTPASPFFTGLDPNFGILANPNYNTTTSSIQFQGTGINVTLDGSTPIITLRFIYNGGSSSLHLRKSPDAIPRCLIIDEIGSPVEPYTFSDLMVNGTGFLELKSIETGTTLLWKNSTTWRFMDGTPVPNGCIPTGIVNTTITGALVTIDSPVPPATAPQIRTKNLTIYPAGKLTLNASRSLAVTGNLLIQSDATSTGSFVDLGTTTVTGSTSVERYTTGTWDGNWPPATITWHYVSSPVSGGTISSYEGSLLNEWKEDTLSTGYWKPLTLPLTKPLVVNKGYSAATTTNKVITFTGGTLNTGNRTITGLTNTGMSDARGFNLVGNAYPSAVIWDGAVTRTNVDAAAYFYDGVTNNYIPHMTTDAVKYQIPAEQGFFVHVTTGSATGSITIPNTNRVHSANAYVKSTSGQELILKANGNNLEDMTSIRFNSEATEGFDSEYDAYKLWGATTSPQIYSIAPGDNLAINSIPEMAAQTVVPVGFKVGVNDTYTITASGLETFPGETDIYLEDIFLNKTQNLNLNPVYEFTASTGANAHRFNIRFSPISGLGETTGNNIRIYAAENTVYINIPMELHGEIIVYDLLGKEMKHQSIQGNSLNRINLNVEQGYYLIKVLGDKSTVSGKVFIR